MARLALLVPLALLGGCIIYDTNGKCPGCDHDGWDWSDEDGTDADGDGIPDDVDTDIGDSDDPDAVAFVLDPSQAEIGTAFIASLTADGAYDFASIAGVEIYGDVELIASEVRDDEVLLSLSIPADAEPGTADLLLLSVDGSVEFIGDALAILPVGAGGDGSGTDGGTDGGTDTGDGSGGSDSGGDTGSGGSCP